MVQWMVEELILSLVRESPVTSGFGFFSYKKRPVSQKSLLVLIF